VERQGGIGHEAISTDSYVVDGEQDENDDGTPTASECIEHTRWKSVEIISGTTHHPQLWSTEKHHTVVGRRLLRVRADNASPSVISTP